MKVVTASQIHQLRQAKSEGRQIQTATNTENHQLGLQESNYS